MDAPNRKRRLKEVDDKIAVLKAEGRTLDAIHLMEEVRQVLFVFGFSFFHSHPLLSEPRTPDGTSRAQLRQRAAAVQGP